MKKYIARNAKTGDKVFCKYEMLNTGILRVEYFLPKYGYSVIWDRKNNYCRIHDWIKLVYPFYKKYELNSDERALFTDEYHCQCYYKYGHV